MTSVDPASAPNSDIASSPISKVNSLVARVTDALNSIADTWLLGLGARFTFFAVLFGYYWNAAQTKLDDSLFTLSTGAYAQVVPPIIEAVGYDKTAVPLGWTLLVYAGTYAEFILPVLVVVGLFSRPAALGMLVFIVVQSYVDMAFHGVDAETAGMWFDRFQNSIIFDQRLLWAFPLIYIVLRGPGLLSLDTVLSRWASTR
ncbi:MAG: DoxX family protein [Pseudomonadota bacterium]